MRKIYFNIILFALLVLSCDDNMKDNVYLTKFHNYHWDVDSNPLIIPFSAFDENIEIKDNGGHNGGIIGVTSILAINDQDTMYIHNTGLKDNRNSIISDSLQNDWFTIINKKKSLRIVLNKNKTSKKRLLSLSIWSTHIEYMDDGMAACGGLTIVQNPEIY